jgi:hypothetical protein
MLARALRFWHDAKHVKQHLRGEILGGKDGWFLQKLWQTVGGWTGIL